MRQLESDRHKRGSHPVDYREERYERPRHERRERREDAPRRDMRALPSSGAEHWGRSRDRGRE